MAACDDDNDPVTPAARPTRFVANMANANEIPVATPAAPSSGTATFEYTGANTMTFRIVANSAITNVNNGHIHIGTVDNNGGVIVPYFPTKTPAVSYTAGQEIASGTITNASVSAINSRPAITVDSLRTLMEKGVVYSNIHTSAFTGGEMRAQIVPAP
ncbi:MAG TPA: CHRD domain-containing protein [Gemmatimonadaceae bacterium]|nr:CHRD domain-containing protein [Gemmatimonadaceae bacterium]